MAKTLKVVVAADVQGAALKVAADLEQCGFAPDFCLVRSEEELEIRARRSELVVAWREARSLTVNRVLELSAGWKGGPPVVVYGEQFTEDEVVALLRAGAKDCLRRGDLGRIRAALDRETAPVSRKASHQVDGDDRFRALIEEIPALTYVARADENGSRAYISPQLQAMTGFTPREWLEEPDMWLRRMHPDDREHVLRRFHEACRVGERFSAEYRVIDRVGRVSWWRDEGRVLPGTDGGSRFVRGFVLDVTEQKLAEESLRRLRFYDQLTGLPNRVLLLRQLGRALAEASGSKRPLALLIIALDRFREITNTLGHHNGDRIVRDLAARLSDVLGNREGVARLRGDEFGIVLPDTDAAASARLGDRVLAALGKPFTVERLPIEVSASLGIALAPEHADEAELLLRRADAAVQAARRLGGGSSVLYSPKCELHDPAHVELLGELRQAIEAEELLLHYQPKVDLKAHSVVGAEALLRWPHSSYGFLLPSEFVPLAEQTGLIHILTRWVLDQAVREAHRWAESGRQVPVAVNVSARSLHDSRLLKDVEDALRVHDLPAEGLEIEVTESAVMADPARAADVLGRLRGRGVAVAIDDFGTGYSSLAHLRCLPVSRLKIDKSFVLGMTGDGGEDTAIVRSTADLAHNLGLSVVAEGVEDQWTLDLLSTFGCDQAQGYHIARPMSGANLVRWMGASTWGVI